MDAVSKTARYDGLDEWYDEFASPPAASSQEPIAALLPSNDGLCLDLDCGTGLYFEIIRATGRTAVGLDISADQLRRAASRGQLLAQADAMRLPIRSA